MLRPDLGYEEAERHSRVEVNILGSRLFPEVSSFFVKEIGLFGRMQCSVIGNKLVCAIC